MNYQRTIHSSYIFEAVGYSMLVSAVGATIYGIAEQDMNMVSTGLESIIPALSTIAMPRIVRASVKEVSDTLSATAYK